MFLCTHITIDMTENSNNNNNNLKHFKILRFTTEMFTKTEYSFNSVLIFVKMNKIFHKITKKTFFVLNNT